ncbi:MAG: hypothetical protein GY913_35205 [Proteobacteria bacterium]|nr:hypothetical protein [Pseudomonadota bacterium]MCP4922179.1 hypothetical protein [Pseudomonadota bacterium]
MIFLTTLFACTGAEEEEHDVFHEACEVAGEVHHSLIEGDEIELGHPSEITLTDLGDGTYSATFDLDHAGAVLFVGTEGLTDLGDSTPNPDCPDEMPEHYDIDEATTVTFGPAAVETVWVLYTEAEGHDHANH